VASGANEKFLAGHLTPITADGIVADGIITQFEIPLETQTALSPNLKSRWKP